MKVKSLNSKLIFLGLIIFGGLFGLAERSFAATINAASCSYADVSSAYNAAADGDFVAVPEGNCIWSVTLVLSKPITIQGAGVSLTTITYGSGAGIPLIDIAPASGKEDLLFRITGIYFENVLFGVGSGTTMDVQISGKATGFRIDHCTFHNGTEAVRTNGWVNGVIDNSLFSNINLSIRLADDADIRNSHPTTNSWGRPIQAGSPDSVFIENNTFTTSNVPGCDSLNEYLYHMDAARSTIRYNNFINTCVAGYIDTYIDAHGLPGCDRGTVISDIYNNSFTFYYQSKWMHLRGGSFIVHDNEITTSNGTPRISLRNEQSEVGTGFYFDSSWPSTDQINNSFFWNNRVNGAIVNDIVYIQDEEDSGSFIQEGRDYFLHAPAAIGGKESYGGSAGLSNSRCTGIGTAELIYAGYVFDAPCCMGIGTGTCDMTFSSAGANTYYPYTTYTYPHPLRDESDATPPGVPSGLSVE